MPTTQPPKAGPKTQSEKSARGGGTYGQDDFSQSARRSRHHVERLGPTLRNTETSDAPGDPGDGGPGSI